MGWFTTLEIDSADIKNNKLSARDIAQMRLNELAGTYTMRAHNALSSIKVPIDINSEWYLKQKQNEVLRNLNSQDFIDKEMVKFANSLYEKHAAIFHHFFPSASLQEIICESISLFMAQFTEGMKIHTNGRIIPPARPIYNDIALAIGLYEQNNKIGLTPYGDSVIGKYISIQEKTF